MTSGEYDTVPYITHPRPQTHPDRLAALAALFGMVPAPVADCRVLELGCGDGSNLLPMALDLPESTLVGIDRAAGAVARGEAVAAALGVSNLTLQAMDLADIDSDGPPFDYIIAHGVYSWVPEAVRQRLMAVCRSRLAPQGVAFVSYNTLPGGYLRTIARDIMRFHADRFDGPDERVSQARAILDFVAGAVPARNDTWRRVLADERDHALGYEALFHDDLGTVNAPVHFHQFMAAAEAAGLQYLADAEFATMQDRYLEPSVRDTLSRLGQHDIVVKEQFLDFITGRSFRQSLLCRAEVDLQRRLAPERMHGFLFSSRARVCDPEGRPMDPPFDLLDADRPVMFQAEGGSTLSGVHPVPRAALLRLIAAFPRRLSFDELLASAADPADDTGRRALAEILLSGFAGDLVQIHHHRPAFAASASDRPVACPLARFQAAEGARVVNRVHEVVDLDDPGLRRLLTLLDGTRDRAALAEAVRRDLAADPDGGGTPAAERLAADLDAALALLARHALLVA